MKIRYKFCDGTVKEEEVSGEIYAAVQEIEQYERRLYWRDAKHKFSVDCIEGFLEKNDIDVEDAGSDPLYILMSREDKAEVRKALSRLPEKQRGLIRKVFFEYKTTVEIAKEEGVDRTAISHRLASIYRKLKNFI